MFRALETRLNKETRERVWGDRKSGFGWASGVVATEKGEIKGDDSKRKERYEIERRRKKT